MQIDCEMKKNWIIILFLSVSVLGCKPTYYTHQVNYLEGTAQTISLRCVGYGNDRFMAINDAEQAAVKELLFRGVPLSQQKDALVSTNESESLRKNNSYFNELLSKGRYKTFIISSTPVSDISHYKGSLKQITVDVKINLYGLRKDLEQNNIIRPFGY